MGSQISTNQSEIAQKQVSETVNSIVNNVNNELSSGASSKQTVKIKVGGNFKNSGKFKINQTAQVEMSAFVDNFSQTISRLESDIEANLDVDSIIENTMDQSGIILGQSQISVQSQKISQSFENNLSNLIESAVKSVINVSSETDQTIEFIVDGDFENTISGDWELNQSSVIDSISAAISDTLVDSIVQSTIVNTATASSKMSTTMTQDGISEWAVLMLLLVPLIMFAGGGIAAFTILEKAAKIIMALALPGFFIAAGIMSLIDYNNLVYFKCINDPDSDNYINTELQENGDPVVEGLYINPEFANIPSTTGDPPFPEGFGDPETAYLKPDKQESYNQYAKK